MSLQHVVALVTGAAGGLGRGTATWLVERGARVVFCDLPTTEGAEVAKALGPNARFAPTDVVNEKDVTAALDLAESAFGQSVNVVVNFAGVFPYVPTVDEKHAVHPVKVFRQATDVNLTGIFLVSSLAAQRMSKLPANANGERGVIINTASNLAFEGMIGRVAYAASKAGVVGMTLPMARDLGQFGIRVVCIAPGPFNTPMFSMPQEMKNTYFSDVAFPKRAGEPHEFAHLVQFIIENPVINGETIRLDGGVRIRASL